MHSMWQVGISVLLRWQRSSSGSSLRWEPPYLNQKGLAVTPFQKDIISFWNCLPPESETFLQVLSLAVEEQERTSLTVVGRSSSGMSTGITCCALNLQFCHSGCPIWVLCHSLAGILFVVCHISSHTKVKSLLLHPPLNWNDLCKSLAFP